MNRESDRLSAKPPPEAQLSLNGRDVFGIMEPLRESALAAAAGDAKSMKQYPALLGHVSRVVKQITSVSNLPRELVADHLDIDGLSHAEPDGTDEVLVNPWLQFAHPGEIVSRIGSYIRCAEY